LQALSSRACLPLEAVCEPGVFIEVFVNAPLHICERRDQKGLYAKARAKQIPEFTGISAPYEPPCAPEIELRTDQLSVASCVSDIVEFLQLDATDTLEEAAPSLSRVLAQS
jgi:adenylylsulfate kinase